MSHSLKTAYVLARFPSLTATFVMNEMYWIRQHDIDITIFSLYSPSVEPVHERAKMLLPSARYSPSLSWPVVKAQFHFLRRSPARYLRALANTFRTTYREPKLLLRALTVFPRSVFFARQAEALGIEHLHTHFVLLASVAAGVISELLGISLTVHPHAAGLFTRNQHSVRLQLESASRVVTISNYHRDYILDLCPQLDPSGVEVVHCGIETDRFRQVPNQAKSQPIRLLSVGRLVEKKGHEVLVDACSLLTERGLEYQCQIVGTGPRQKSLQARIEQLGLRDNVTLLGALDQSRVVELCQTSGVFALPCVTAKDGDQDGVPVSLMEAMACELPVVTTPIAGIPDLVQDRETGLLVRERDVSSLADALEELIRGEGLRERLGEQARQKVVEDFEIRHTVAKLAAIFRQVARPADDRAVALSVDSGSDARLARAGSPEPAQWAADLAIRRERTEYTSERQSNA